MPISFLGINPSLRVPGVYVEISNSRALRGLFTLPRRLLVVGQRLTTGTQAALTLQLVTSEAQGAEYFGSGSMLHGMLRAVFAQRPFVPVYAIALADAGASTAATGQIAFTGPSTAAGTLYLYLAGYRLTLAVPSGTSAGAVASGLATAVNAATYLPVTANAASGTITFTARNKGTIGNALDIRLNYYAGESLPAGIGAPITPMAGGATDPDLSTILPVLGEEQFTEWVIPYLDATSLTALDAELESRWGPMRQNDGRAFFGTSRTHANLVTFGASLNSKHFVVAGLENLPAPGYELAGAVAAQAAMSAQNDPARPFTTLPLEGILPPATADAFITTERDILLHNGISTAVVDSGGKLRIEPLMTTYQKNANLASDITFLDLTAFSRLGYLRYDLRNYLLNKYPRHKLADDGAQYGPGQAIVTPSVMKAEVVGRFRQWEFLGLVENADQFLTDLVVERNVQDPNRLDILASPDLVNQLLVAGVQLEFIL